MSDSAWLRGALRRRWPLPEQPETCTALLDAYDHPRRGYHDLLHLADVLEALDALEPTEPFGRLPVRLAAWFHDGVYDGAPDDEARSAAWAQAELPDPLGAEVARLVLLTAHHHPAPDDLDGAALCDADLAVLGTLSARRYADYVAGVRAEYAVHPLADFCAGRARILRDLLRGTLFHTATGRERWEGNARINLFLELVVLDELAQGGPPDRHPHPDRP